MRQIWSQLNDKQKLVFGFFGVMLVFVGISPMFRGHLPHDPQAHASMASMDDHSGHGQHQGQGNDDPGVVVLSHRARALAQVQVVPVERKQIQAEVKLFGKVDYDERRLARITAWVPGRIERLYLNFTGMTVNKGDPMVDFYSPQLLTAREELRQSLQILRELENETTSFLKEKALQNLEAGRNKLSLWGLTDEQIDAMEAGDQGELLTITAPISGVVIKKPILEGAYVNVGTEIYALAALDNLWVKLDAYESDLGWLQQDQEVEFITDAHPGKTFHGRVAFIDPFLNEHTRTATVRVDVKNDDNLLKPGMYLRAVVRPYVSSSGQVYSMHIEMEHYGAAEPEHHDMESASPHSDEPEMVAGGMDTVPLVVPSTAPLLTGKRAVVYVQSPDRDHAYSARQVILGPRVGDHYIVNDGLEEGELVVVNGNFKIDSASQILAKPSMMAPKGGVKRVGGHSGH